MAASNIDPRELTNVLLAPFTVIGSVTAFTAGAMAARELAFGRGRSGDVQDAINFGIARGFLIALLPSIFALAGALASL